MSATSDDVAGFLAVLARLDDPGSDSGAGSGSGSGSGSGAASGSGSEAGSGAGSGSGLDPAERQRLERAVTEAARAIKRRAKARRHRESTAADQSLLAAATRFHTEIPDPGPAAEARPVLEARPAAEAPPAAEARLTAEARPIAEVGEVAGVAAPLEAAACAPGVAPIGTLRRDRRCYVCKTPYRKVDPDYHQMCTGCADHNRVWRTARTDLTGHTAVVTGGRVKIGFHAALKLLRDGAEVIVTTRFPRDAARRFAAVPDFGDWAGRLTVYGLDLLDLPAVMDFVASIDRLDILINNAAQTLQRPAAYHREVRAAEALPLTGPAAQLSAGPAARLGVSADPAAQLSAGAALLNAGATRDGSTPTDATPDDATLAAATPDDATPDDATPDGSASDGSSPDNDAAVRNALFPAGLLDETGLQLDLRGTNSWMLRDADVSPQEWLQVHVVNAFAPFLLTARLRPVLAASTHPRRHVVQVSAMEGSFSRLTKTVRHPHTNMAKASLNMLVRTVAADYARDGILMNAVDTGWVTDERPHPGKQAQRAAGFRPPLDVVDGAARVYHPIVAAGRGEPISGQFLKDYRSVHW